MIGTSKVRSSHHRTTSSRKANLPASTNDLCRSMQKFNKLPAQNLSFVFFRFFPFFVSSVLCVYFSVLRFDGLCSCKNVICFSIKMSASLSLSVLRASSFSFFFSIFYRLSLSNSVFVLGFGGSCCWWRCISTKTSASFLSNNEPKLLDNEIIDPLL